MATVAVIGAGVMGTALTWPLSDNGHAVRLVGTHLDEEIIAACRGNHHHPHLELPIPAGVDLFSSTELGLAVSGAEVVVSGVSSSGVRWFGEKVVPCLRTGQQVVAVTKGLEATDAGDLRILPDVLSSYLPAGVSCMAVQAAIGGPCIARELARRAQTCVVFGARDEATAQDLAKRFRTSYYHVWTTSDLVGLELCAAMKNGYAIGVGLAKGFLEREAGEKTAAAVQHNLPAAVFAQACGEMAQLLALVGARRDLAWGLAGAGDLYVTCQGGRNMRLGRLLGLGYSFAEAQEKMAGETLEGVQTVRVLGAALPSLRSRGRISSDSVPLLRTLISVIVEGREARLALDGYFRQS